MKPLSCGSSFLLFYSVKSGVAFGAGNEPPRVAGRRAAHGTGAPARAAIASYI